MLAAMPGKRGLADSRSIDDKPRRPTSPCCWIRTSCPQAPTMLSILVCLCPLLKIVVLLPALSLGVAF
ncbi:uncharacterized protein CTRU02_202620 [Colletotrichum truncatum]|uniref:Uncharacterized protein n=1 Tax=Colletotrichum truncatum TaxID=5467 RepID=A0ACC3ZL82_COLTU